MLRKPNMVEYWVNSQIKGIFLKKICKIWVWILLTFAVDMCKTIGFCCFAMEFVFWCVGDWMFKGWAASIIINETIGRVIEIIMSGRCLVATSVGIHWTRLCSDFGSTHGIVLKQRFSASFLARDISGRWLGVDTGVTGICSVGTCIEFVCDSIKTAIASWINVAIACDLTIFELNVWCSSFSTFLDDIWWRSRATAFYSILH